MRVDDLGGTPELDEERRLLDEVDAAEARIKELQRDRADLAKHLRWALGMVGQMVPIDQAALGSYLDAKAFLCALDAEPD